VTQTALHLCAMLRTRAAQAEVLGRRRLPPSMSYNKMKILCLALPVSSEYFRHLSARRSSKQARLSQDGAASEPVCAQSAIQCACWTRSRPVRSSPQGGSSDGRPKNATDKASEASSGKRGSTIWSETSATLLLEAAFVTNAAVTGVSACPLPHPRARPRLRVQHGVPSVAASAAL
jgi:hypothetical protein